MSLTWNFVGRGGRASLTFRVTRFWRIIDLSDFVIACLQEMR